MDMAQQTPRYRAPSVCVDVDVDLSEFDLEEIAEYLRHNGYKVSATGATHNPATGTTDNVLDPDELDRVFTLDLCGQRVAAQQIALQLVGDAIGRPIH
jgi:hypothetical protein